MNVNNPQDGATILLEPNAKEGSTAISGATEKGANVTVQAKSASDSQPISVTVDDSGNFTSPVITAPLGSSVFEIVAKDRAGNTTTKTIRVTFQAKSSAVTGGSIVLTTDFFGSEDIKASWAFSGSLTAPDGVIIVYGKNTSPTLSDDSSSTIKSSTFTKISLSKLDSGESYYFRACVYDKKDDKCTVYSNQTSLDIP